MFKRNKIFSQPSNFVVIASLVLAGGLMVSYAKNIVRPGWANDSLGSFVLSNPPQRSALDAPITTNFFTSAGLPVSIQTAAASNAQGGTKLNYGITNIGNSEISGIDLALFEFSPIGGLMTVQGWSLSTKLAISQSANFSLQLKIPALTNSRLVLTAEAVRGNTDFGNNRATHWQVNFTELAQTIGVLMEGGSVPSLQTTQRTAAIPELFGASYCSDAFSKAFQFSKTGDGMPLSAFSCDRNNRSVVFGFNSKVLTSKKR